MKAVAKINIFLKITGTRDNYHEIASRFIRYEKLYDIIEFIPSKQKTFTIEGIDIPLKSNIIYKAYQKLKAIDRKIEYFFKEHKVVIQKNIPFGAGLGGGSSNGATFLLMCNEIMKLPHKKLLEIGASLGADVPFFLSGFPSANVSGIGEVIEPFDDEIPEIELFTPPTHCDTAKVYQHFRKNYLQTIDTKIANIMLKKSSKTILNEFTPLKANDLYKSSIDLYPTLHQYKDTYFLSGSGSSVFKEKR